MRCIGTGVELKKEELNTPLVMEVTETDRSNCKPHVLQVPRPRIPLEVLRYDPEGLRSLGRAFTDAVMRL
jgi:hypothetical protein